MVDHDKPIYAMVFALWHASTIAHRGASRYIEKHAGQARTTQRADGHGTSDCNRDERQAAKQYIQLWLMEEEGIAYYEN